MPGEDHEQWVVCPLCRWRREDMKPWETCSLGRIYEERTGRPLRLKCVVPVWVAVEYGLQDHFAVDDVVWLHEKREQERERAGS